MVQKPTINCLGQIQEDIDNANYVVTIAWGRDAEKKETFGFDNINSYQGFLDGVEASSGWLEYAIEADVEPYHHTEPFDADHPRKLNTQYYDQYEESYDDAS